MAVQATIGRYIVASTADDLDHVHDEKTLLPDNNNNIDAVDPGSWGDLVIVFDDETLRNLETNNLIPRTFSFTLPDDKRHREL